MEVVNTLAYCDMATVTIVKEMYCTIPGVSMINLFGVNLLTLYCKLDISVAMHQIELIFIKWSSLQKSVSKFTPK